MHFRNTFVDHFKRYWKLCLLHHTEAEADVRDLGVEHERIAQAVIGRIAYLANNLLAEH
jgi:hypothetical protein